MEPFLRNLSHPVHLWCETPCKCHSALTWVSLPWAVIASSCPRTAWLQWWLGGWLWLEAQTSALSPDSQPWHSSQKSPRLSTADFKCRINTTKSPTQTCIWTKILYCSSQRTELNLWVQILHRTLRSSKYTDAEPPVTRKPQSHWPSQYCLHRGLVGVSRTLWPWIRRSWFLIQASHQPVVGFWTSHWPSPDLSSRISGVPTLPRLQSYPKNSDVEITTNFRSFYTSRLVGYWGGSRERDKWIDR